MTQKEFYQKMDEVTAPDFVDFSILVPLIKEAGEQGLHLIVGGHKIDDEFIALETVLANPQDFLDANGNVDEERIRKLSPEERRVYVSCYSSPAQAKGFQTVKLGVKDLIENYLSNECFVGLKFNGNIPVPKDDLSRCIHFRRRILFRVG